MVDSTPEAGGGSSFGLDIDLWFCESSRVSSLRLKDLVILKYDWSNVLISRQDTRIQPQVCLQNTACFVQQSSNNNTVRKCCPSLLFILHLDGVQSVEVLLKRLGIEVEIKKLGAK